MSAATEAAWVSLADITQCCKERTTPVLYVVGITRTPRETDSVELWRKPRANPPGKAGAVRTVRERGGQALQTNANLVGHLARWIGRHRRHQIKKHADVVTAGARKPPLIVEQTKLFGRSQTRRAITCQHSHDIGLVLGDVVADARGVREDGRGARGQRKGLCAC